MLPSTFRKVPVRGRAGAGGRSVNGRSENLPAAPRRRGSPGPIPHGPPRGLRAASARAAGSRRRGLPRALRPNRRPGSVPSRSTRGGARCGSSTSESPPPGRVRERGILFARDRVLLSWARVRFAKRFATRSAVSVSPSALRTDRRRVPASGRRAFHWVAQAACRPRRPEIRISALRSSRRRLSGPRPRAPCAARMFPVKRLGLHGRRARDVPATYRHVVGTGRARGAGVSRIGGPNRGGDRRARRARDCLRDCLRPRRPRSTRASRRRRAVPPGGGARADAGSRNAPAPARPRGRSASAPPPAPSRSLALVLVPGPLRRPLGPPGPPSTPWDGGLEALHGEAAPRASGPGASRRRATEGTPASARGERDGWPSPPGGSRNA